MTSVVQPARQFNELPKRNQEFVKEYVRCGDELKAYIAVGYKESRLSKQKARELKKQLSRFIADEVKNYASSTDMAILALNRLADLAENSDSDAVKLQASKEILTRCGLDAPKEVTINHTTKNLTDEEIDKRLAKLSKDLGYNVIDVTPEKARITQSA